ncbi:hypothetical protein MLD38_007696 [Melastoma candidum]|uniref:Uncharacterized protein n=1 Tax=Melastoma candidum TaxID=119954 RepID=A0ACB9RS25_9MYRT|nr:hypothetical protein MLD38_007696 [Melastoma candidum]
MSFKDKELDISGAHTDYGLLTLVNPDDSITALQVFCSVRRGTSPESGSLQSGSLPWTFLCNIGDMLKRCGSGQTGCTTTPLHLAPCHQQIASVLRLCSIIIRAEL